MIRGALALVFLLSATGALADQPLRVDPAALIVGQPGAASIALAPAPGVTIPPDAPLSLTATPPTGVRAPRPRLRRADAADPRAQAPRFDLALAGDTPGSYVVPVVARFWSCGRRSCWPTRATVDVPVTVALPPAASPPDAPTAPAPPVVTPSPGGRAP